MTKDERDWAATEVLYRRYRKLDEKARAVIAAGRPHDSVRHGRALAETLLRPLSVCHICERSTHDFPAWDKGKWACRPCWNGYVNFRRAYKAEHGRYPSVRDFRA